MEATPIDQMPDLYDQACLTAEHVLKDVPDGLENPVVAIICGSGLGGLADLVKQEPRHEVPYSSIPYFATSTVVGHEGKLVFGLLGEAETPVVLMVGRTHFYEGHSITAITFPIRVFRVMRVKTIIEVTNAAGGLNPDYAVGDVVVLNDHLNLAGLVGVHPLRGPNSDDFGVRFPALSDAYDLDLRRKAHQSWKSLGLASGKRRLHEGVYAFVGGPSYETRAECRMLRALGADVVGMSTVPEIIVARHCGLRVLALSLVTNNAVLDVGPRGDDPKLEGMSGQGMNEAIESGKASHEEVLQAGKEAAKDVQALVKQVVESLSGDLSMEMPTDEGGSCRFA